MSRDRLLAERRILLFGPSELEGVARLLREGGADVQRAQLVASGSTRSLEAWISALLEGAFDDVLFLTAQGVRVLVEFAAQRGREDEVLLALSRARIVASGAKTRVALGELGLRPAIAGDEPGRPTLYEALWASSFSGRTLGVAALSCDPRLVAAAGARGAKVRVLGAEEPHDARPRALLARILSRDFDSIAFGSTRELGALFAAAVPSQRAALVQALTLTKTVALGQSVARSLSERGVAPAGVIELSSLLRPRGVDFHGIFGGTTGTSRPASRARSARERRRLVVIGCGEVTHRLCELLGDYGGAESLQVSVFCDDLVPDVNWYKQRKIRLLLGERAVRIDRGRRAVLSSSGEWMRFDAAVIATDSPPCIPPIPGAQKHGVFVYRSTEDLAAIREYARRAAVAAVLGGGLLGFEAAKAVRDLGLETHVVELPPRSGPRQLDTESARSLARRVKALGVRIHTARSAAEIIGGARVEGLSLEGAETLTCDLIVISAGNRPHDELARDAGLQIGERGGILVDDQLRTTDRDIFAIGDCALHRETLHGTVAPGYEMVEVCARTLLGSDASLAPRDPASAAE